MTATFQQKRERRQGRQEPAPDAGGDRPVSLKMRRPWDAMVSLETTIPPPPEFPLGVLPKGAADFAAEVARAAKVAPDYAAASCLAVAAGAVGATVELAVKGDWKERPSLFVGLVGDSSEKKTPCMRSATRPFFALNREWMTRKEDQYDVRHKSVKREDGHKCPAYRHGEGELITTNCTIEGLATVFERQRRGIAYIRSELRGWLDGLNQYKSGGKGDERQNYLELYDGGAVYITRSKRSIRIEDCCLNILGGVQPSAIAPFFQSRDGLAARFLWVYPAGRTPQPEDWATVDEHLKEVWDRIVRSLIQVQMNGDDIDGYTPQTFRFDAEARQAWVRFSEWFCEQQSDRERGPMFREFAGKLEGVGARLAITLRMLAEHAGEKRPPLVVTARDVEGAAELARYFAAMAMRVYGACGADEKLEGAKAILEWVRRHQHEKDKVYRNEDGEWEFSRATLWKTWARTRSEYQHNPNSPALLAQIEELVNASILRPAGDQPHAGKGRKPSAAWEVNPEVFEDAK